MSTVEGATFSLAEEVAHEERKRRAPSIDTLIMASNEEASPSKQHHAGDSNEGMYYIVMASVLQR